MHGKGPSNPKLKSFCEGLRPKMQLQVHSRRHAPKGLASSVAGLGFREGPVYKSYYISGSL